MDLETLAVAAGAVATALGGFAGGRRSATGTNSQVASDTVDMLSMQVNLLTEQNNSKDGRIATLENRVGILEGLVTQRADVETVKEIVTRIAEKLEVQ